MLDPLTVDFHKIYKKLCDLQTTTNNHSITRCQLHDIVGEDKVACCNIEFGISNCNFNEIKKVVDLMLNMKIIEKTVYLHEYYLLVKND